MAVGEINKGSKLARLKKKFYRRNIDYDALAQFVISIRSDLNLFTVTDESDHPDRQQIIQKMDEELSNIHESISLEQNWRRAYHAEKLLLSLYSDNRVVIELQRRLDLSRRLKTPFAEFYAQMTNDVNQTDELAVDSSESPAEPSSVPMSAYREILIPLVTDLQWFSNQQYLKTRYATLAIYNVGTVFVIAFFLFLTVMTLGHWAPVIEESAAGTEQTIEAEEGAQ